MITRLMPFSPTTALLAITKVRWRQLNNGGETHHTHPLRATASRMECAYL